MNVAFSTPALLVDLDTFDANVAAMEALLEGTGKTVRPHVKTHRTPALARRQLTGHVRGLTCATVGEAEAMVDAGLDDVLIANEVVDQAKLMRVARLAERATVTLGVDAIEPLRALSEAALAAGSTVGVVVDVDIHLGRCGVERPADALALARSADAAPGLRFRGLMGYEGRIRGSVPDRGAVIARAYARLMSARDAIEQAGLPIEIVSVGGTSTLREALAQPGITEVQAGVYAVMEPDLDDLRLPFACAVVIRGTVISRHPDHFVLDVGRRSVGMEYGPPRPVSLTTADVKVNDEHTIVWVSGETPPLGAHVDLRPGQVRTTFNLYDSVWTMRDGQPVEAIPVAARGRSW